jgi:hypothetical protein
MVTEKDLVEACDALDVSAFFLLVGLCAVLKIACRGHLLSFSFTPRWGTWTTIPPRIRTHTTLPSSTLGPNPSSWTHSHSFCHFAGGIQSSNSTLSTYQPPLPFPSSDKLVPKGCPT